MSNVSSTTKITAYFDISMERQSDWKELLEGDVISNYLNGEEIDSIGGELVDGTFVALRLIEAEPTPYMEIFLLKPDGNSHYSIPVEAFGSSVTFELPSLSYVINI